MQASEAIDLLMKIISIPSFSGEEDRVADLMEMTWAETRLSGLPERK